MRVAAIIGAVSLACSTTTANAAPTAHGPVLDMHVHAYGAGGQGPPSFVCAPFPAFKPLDPGTGGKGLPGYMRSMFGEPDCPKKYRSASSDDDLRTRTIAMLRKHDVYAIAGGSPAYVDRWLRDEPTRILPAVGAGSPDKLPSVEELRQRHTLGRLKALSELSLQYQGIAPGDPRMEPYWALAEELDVPVGIHMGPGPPGTTYFATPLYRAALTDPLQLEPILVRHPKLRVFVVHAGYPMKERMLALMAAHPQVYAEFGFLTIGYRDSDIWPYLQSFIDAGFEDRILYGTDQMVWPELIEVGIQRVWTAPRLTRTQKRKFLYENAARFLRIDPAKTGILQR
ncbi:amidohydrolase family protein [Sphingomonas piscis]|uniref:Amidohydrolase family protein n=1 Tax=Sphingomonas piscis TaxID=2714943 RepID=A0A6G7YMD2_9SPHN|nr:amidohydrolase family protein [Sphingomonas piscis]QIK77887.1 amidohydrolase family protein [Sphingomonas piscis]